jgi:hypothetical protein
MANIELMRVSEGMRPAKWSSLIPESSTTRHWINGTFRSASWFILQLTKWCTFEKVKYRRETCRNRSLYEVITPIGICCSCGEALSECRCVHDPKLPTHRETAAATIFQSVETCLAAVLTNVLKIRSLLARLTAGQSQSQLYSERCAMMQDARKTDFMEDVYDATLDRLGNRRTDRSWSQRIFLKAQHDYILPYERSGPHLLRIESVQEWLSDYQVRADLKSLATDRILAFGTDADVIRRRLGQSYARYTSDDSELAKIYIETALSGLVAGALSSFSTSQRLTVSLVQRTNLRINQTNFEILSAISRIESLIHREIRAGTATGALQCLGDYGQS